MEEEKKAPEITKVTSDKSKDPKKVEAGKKLAQISKQAKEKKKRERMMQERSDNFVDDYYMYFIGAIGIVLAAASLYYAKKDSDNLDKAINEKKDDRVDESPITVTVRTEAESRLEYL